MSFIPSNKDDLQTAVDAWIADEATATSTYGDINTWNTSLITDMSDLFRNKREFNGNIINWDVSNVTDMHRMFSGAYSFNQPIGNWITSKVTNMYYMFRDARLFNQNINNWDVSKVTTMWAMFGGAYKFNQSLNDWDVSKVTNMGFMFYSAVTFNGIIRNWNVSNVKYMDYMFQGADMFNEQLGTWNVANVTTMKGMFYYAELFNQPIGDWNTGSVTTFNKMFSFNPVFNQPIGDWNTSNVTNMHAMFYPLSPFNQIIGEWDTSKVTDMSYMFNGASDFNQYIRGWDTITTSTNMGSMFNGATEMHNTYTGTAGFSNNPTNEFFNQPYDSNIYNTPPVANVDEVVTIKNTSVNINVIGNDTDVDGDSLTISSASATNGTVVMQSDQTITYTPTTGFTGTDTISYTITDGQGGSDSSTVTVTVNTQENRPPVANVDEVTTNENTSTIINAISNDTDADGDTITVYSASATNGTVLIQSDETLLYTPNTEFFGSDTISYTINDGRGGSDSSTVSVTVTETPNTPPVANVDEITTNKNTSVTIDATSNDTDADGNTLTVYIASATNGTVVIQNDGTLLYTPTTDFAGTDTISYTINDGQGGASSSTVTVSVNTPPVANVDEITTNKNTNITVNVTSNDTDADGDSLTVSSSSATNGTIVIQNDGTLLYTPTTDYAGSDTISYTISDGRGGSANSTVTVTINTPPVANVDEIRINKNIATLINIISNDTDADGDTLTVYSASATNGTVVIQNDETILYTPTTDYVGTDTISYTINDGRGGSANSTVTVTINTIPVANVDEIVTNKNTDVNINVISNDTDADGDTLTVYSASATNGTIVIQNDGTLLYTPTTDYVGSDTISYTIKDGRGGSANSTVSVTVNTPPVANSNEVITNKNTSVSINVTSNDTDADGDSLTIYSAGATNGTVIIQNDGTLLYAPTTDYVGTDTISYTINDGRGGSANSTVTVTINTPPVANVDEVITNKNTDVNINVISNDTDADGDSLTVYSASATNGTVVVQNDGTLLYTPTTDYIGSDTISYTIKDGRGGSANSTVTVTVNTPPVANVDEIVTNKNNSVTINATSNDTDADGDSLTIYSASATNGTVVIQNDGTLLYTPTTDYVGTDTISYTINDGRGGSANSTVTVTINTPPVANVDEIVTTKNTDVNINVISNDTDADGDSLTVYSASATNGTVVIQNDGTLLYTPATDYTGADTISYTINDGRGGSANSTVTVTVNAPPITPPPVVVNVPPVVVNDTATTYNGHPVTIDVLSNDYDPDGDILTITSAIGSYGTITINDDETIEYTPDTNFFGTDTINYTVNDGNGGSGDGNVTLISEICFTKDALVLTDQGYIAIDQIDITKHTIRKQRIIAITKTVNKTPYLICIKESALGDNIPSHDTTMSRDHMLYYKDGKINANGLEELEPNVCKVENTKTVLYNVLLESYSNMTVNNMMVETLHPDNIIAKTVLWNISNQLHEISKSSNSHN